jgi:hypothetical protein
MSSGEERADGVPFRGSQNAVAIEALRVERDNLLRGIAQARAETSQYRRRWDARGFILGLVTIPGAIVAVVVVAFLLKMLLK